MYMCSGITRGRVISGEVYAQRFHKSDLFRRLKRNLHEAVCKIIADTLTSEIFVYQWPLFTGANTKSSICCGKQLLMLGTAHRMQNIEPSVSASELSIFIGHLNINGT